MFTYVETIQYTNELLYSVLSEALNIQEERFPVTPPARL